MRNRCFQGLGALGERGVELLGPLGHAHFEIVRAAAQYGFKRLDALGHRGVDALRMVVQDGLQHRGALAEGLAKRLRFLGERPFQGRQVARGALDDGAEARLLGAKLVEDHRDFPPNPLAHTYDGRDEAVAFGGDGSSRAVGTLLDGACHFKARHAHRFRRLRAVLDELLGDAGAALGKLFVDGRSGRAHGGGDLLPPRGERLAHGNGGVAEGLRCFFARGGDLSCNLAANAAQSLAHPLAIIGQRLALARKLVDEVPDPVLVFRVGTLQRRDLVMDQRLKLARPAEGAGNCVVHRRDLPAHGLPQRGNRLFGHAVGFGEPDRDLGHRRGHQAQFLGAPDQDCQEPEQRNRNGHGRDNRDNGWIGEHVGGAAGGVHGLLEHGIGHAEPKHEPNPGSYRRNQERGSRWPLLERVDQPADGRHVVIGRDVRPRRAPGTLLRGGPGSRAWRNLNGVAGRSDAARVPALREFPALDFAARPLRACQPQLPPEPFRSHSAALPHLPE